MGRDEGLTISPAIDGPAELPTLSPVLARELLDLSSVDTIEFARPPVDQTPYGPFIRAMLTAQPFKCDFEGRSPDVAFAMISDQLFGPGRFASERKTLSREVTAVAAFSAALGGGGGVTVTMRTHFAPGDLVWHVDRSLQRDAIRVVWPLGRTAGMRVTTADNIDEQVYRPYMRRELPLLCELDRDAFRTGAPLEALWAHRPRQVEAMTSGRYPFLRDAGKVWEIHRDAISVHRFQTPYHRGTYHRSSWENHSCPGVQIVMTTGAA